MSKREDRLNFLDTIARVSRSIGQGIINKDLGMQMSRSSPRSNADRKFVRVNLKVRRCRPDERGPK
jgi:hypothetical protein